MLKSDGKIHEKVAEQNSGIIFLRPKHPVQQIQPVNVLKPDVNQFRVIKGGRGVNTFGGGEISVVLMNLFELSALLNVDTIVE